MRLAMDRRKFLKFSAAASAAAVATSRSAFAESPLAMECTVVEIRQVPGANSWLVLGEVLEFHTSPQVWKNERIDLSVVRPLTRLGGNDYGRFGEIVNRKRPVFAKIAATADLQK